MIRAGGDRRHALRHTCPVAPSQALGVHAPDRRARTIDQHGATVVADPFELDRRRTLPVGLTVSTGWDRDEAHAFVEELFAKHQNEIYAYLLRMLRDPELAADLTQDAFVKAYRAYDSLEKPENARAWLYQIAHRVALDDLRRGHIVRFLPSPASRATRRPRRSTW